MIIPHPEENNLRRSYQRVGGIIVFLICISRVTVSFEHFKGHSHEENQVSRQSSSCRSCAFGIEKLSIEHFLLPPLLLPLLQNRPLSSYHAGILCPHHSWREIHQSLIFSIQCRYRFWIWQDRILFHHPVLHFQRRAGYFFISTHHCRDRRGSTTHQFFQNVPLRWYNLRF